LEVALMRRRVVSVLVGLAVGAVAYFICGSYVSAPYGPLIVGGSAAVLAAMGWSELWLAFAKAGRVMDAAASVRTDDGRGPGGDELAAPTGSTVTASASARVVCDRNRLAIRIDSPRRWQGQHRMPKANAR
jgi:hypothetical protein